MENLLRIYLIRFLLSIPVGLVFILFVLSPLVRLLLVYDGPPKSGEFAKYLVKIYSVKDVSENIWLYLFLSLFIGEVVCFLSERLFYSIYVSFHSIYKEFMIMFKLSKRLSKRDRYIKSDYTTICRTNSDYCIGLAEGYYSLSKAMAGFSVSLFLAFFVFYIVVTFLLYNDSSESVEFFGLTIKFVPDGVRIFAVYMVLMLILLLLLVFFRVENPLTLLISLITLYIFVSPFILSIFSVFQKQELNFLGLILLIASYIMISSLLAFFIYRKKYEELMRAIYRRANLKRKH